MYDSIFAKSFSKHERQKLGWGAFLACFIIALTLCTVFKPYLVPLPILNLGLSTASGLRMLMSSDEPGRSQESSLGGRLASVYHVTRIEYGVYQPEEGVGSQVHGLVSSYLEGYNFLMAAVSTAANVSIHDGKRSDILIDPPRSINLLRRPRLTSSNVSRQSM
ncbi:Uncharacterized protein Adt_45102 [Abeliophyllum distichum]|uniref:Uncharacterized protein n=1 Tax=Abeliophyllum distichum TaxID=126358 RepID=A0ABD1PCV6_9LAMI